MYPPWPVPSGDAQGMIWRNDKDGIGLIEGEMAKGADLERGTCSRERAA